MPFLYAIFLAHHYMNPPDVRAEAKLRQDQDGFWGTKKKQGTVKQHDRYSLR